MMSHPIANTMDYIHQNERNGYEEDDEESNVDEKPTDPTSRWHSILRRMSINIQRDEGTPDHEIITSTSPSYPTDHERALMLNIPHYSSSSEDFGDETVEDDTLPTVQEIITEYIDNTNNVLHSQQTNYFENPFESDTASTDDTVYIQPTQNKNALHPLSVATPEKKNHGTVPSIKDHALMQTDSAQGTNLSLVRYFPFFLTFI